MREFIQQNPNRWADQIRLRRSAFKGAFIIVEGHNDEKFYSNFVNHKTCEFAITDGKEQAINTIQVLDNDNFSGIVAILDSDFDRLENNFPDSSNILLTDDHDLEMMIIKTPALEKLIRERGNKEKIKDTDIRKVLIGLGQEIGYLRWVSLREKLSLKFEDLKFDKFINDKTLILDSSVLIKTIKNHSQKLSLIDQYIQESIEQLKDDAYDPLQVCCGHDIIQILSLALCKAWGTWNRNEVKPELLERELRLAYESSYFCQTQLYCLIKNWQDSNSPYQVLNS